MNFETFDRDAYNEGVLQRLADREWRPLGVMIQVSARCNLGCKMCGYVGIAPNKAMMEYDLFLRVLDACREDGIKRIYFNTAWGEPLLNPRIFDMIEAASDFEIFLSTNGTPLTEKRINLLTDANIATIQVSFAGYDQDSYESVYVGSRFDKVSENIRMLKARLVEKGAASKLVINGVSLHDDPAFVEKSHRFLRTLGLGDDEINIVLPCNYGGLYDPSRQNSPGVKSLKQEIDNTLVICSVLADNPGVLYDGRVTVCGCLDDAGALVIGNIQDETIMDMRHGPKFTGMIEKFRAGDVSDLPLCSDCDVPYGEARLQRRNAAE